MTKAFWDNDILLIRFATYASVSLAAVLIVIKAFAWYVTGSVSLQATLVDSALDAVASLINLIAVRHALRPADDEHRFGHGKIEAVAALGQSIFVSLSSFWLLHSAFERFTQPSSIPSVSIGFIVMLVSIFLTIFLIIFQRHVIKRTGSAAIKADSIHYQGDALINFSVIIALALGRWFNFKYADPFFGTLIAFYILYTAWEIIQHSFDILVDREFPENERQIIREIALSHPEVRGIHDLRTRSSGTKSFIQLHLEMDGHMTLRKAHDIALEVTILIKEKFPRTEIMIHQDPEMDLDHS
jgi:ferrous-iron efflux pump FieF